MRFGAKSILILLMIFSVIGFVSALTPLQELMSDQATGMTITMTQDTTVDNFYLDTAGLSFDNQTLTSGGNSITLPISGFLNGINLRVDLIDGETSLDFLNVDISDSPLNIILNGVPVAISNGDIGIFDLLRYYNITDFSFTSDITHDTQVLNDLAQANPLPEPMVGNAYFVKNGNNYVAGYNEGFGSVPSEYKNEIAEAIIRGVNSMNVQSLIEQNLGLINISEYLPVLQELGYEVTEVDYTGAVALILENINYNISVDLTNIAFQDGTYEIPVTITPLSGDTTPVTKTVTLVLSGIINEVDGEIVIGNIYTPSDPGVREVISHITGLPNGTVISIQTSNVPPAGVNILGNTEVMKYLVIETNQLGGANITFTVPTSAVDPNKVSLYVWENGGWTKLSTNYNGIVDGEYQFTATTPHFSTFMIGEETSTGTSTSSAQGGSRRSSSSNNVGEQENVLVTGGEIENLGSTGSEEKPVDLTGNRGAPITGGVIGFLKSGAGISLIAGLVVAIGAIGFFSFRNRAGAKAKVAAKKE